MQVNYLWVSLADESKQWLQQLCQSHPEVTLNWEPKVEIMTTLDPVEPEPLRVYQGAVTNFDIWYNTELGTSQGIISLDSPSLVGEHDTLIAENVQPAFSTPYVPHIVFIEYMPPSKRRLKAWLNSVATAMVGQKLFFTNEQMEVVDRSTGFEHDYCEANQSLAEAARNA